MKNILKKFNTLHKRKRANILATLLFSVFVLLYLVSLYFNIKYTYFPY